jgi:hypothetical protein
MNKIFISKILMVEYTVIFLTAISMLAAEVAFLIHSGTLTFIDSLGFLFGLFMLVLSYRYACHKSVVMNTKRPNCLFD